MASNPLSNKYEQRAYIKICSLLDEKPLQIHEKLVIVFHGDALSIQKVIKWARRVKEGRHGIEDQPRAGRPISSSTPEIITQIQELVGIESHLTIEEIGIILDISSGSVYSILHDTLDYKKISASWIPKLLTKEQKEKVSCSKNCSKIRPL